MSDVAVAFDAAIVLGLASTAMPFARTPEAEAERWLRILRLHGEAGVALQAIGVSEGRLEQPVRDVDRYIDADGGSGAAGAERADPVNQVIAEATEIAARRGQAGLATTDLLLAVMCFYGEDFDRVLQAHGTDREELLERLGIALTVSEICD